MRTTVTLDDDVAAAVQRLARERGLPFKQALNALLRVGLASGNTTSKPYAVPSRALDLRAGVDLDKALRLVGELEDEEIVRKLELRK
jgi:hypothetical protein